MPVSTPRLSAKSTINSITQNISLPVRPAFHLGIRLPKVALGFGQLFKVGIKVRQKKEDNKRKAERRQDQYNDPAQDKHCHFAPP